MTEVIKSLSDIVSCGDEDTLLRVGEYDAGNDNEREFLRVPSLTIENWLMR